MFQPIVPQNGLAGWRFLQRTYDAQFETFTKSVELQRDSDYFREKIGEAVTADALVSDRRLLTVALGAFGLADDLNNRYFIRKVLEEGTTDDEALANRFTDPRYAELSEAFGYGPAEFTKVDQLAFVEAIIDRFEANSFQIAAGDQQPAMRVALYAQREMSDISSMEGSNDAKWFTVMGDPPLRQLFESALNLPSSFGQIDLDQQLKVFQDRAKRVFGTDDLVRFSEPELLEDIITKFVVRDQINANSAAFSSSSVALMLLQN